MSLSLKGRALHFVFKIGNRDATSEFLKSILGMTALRHEEFADGCAATCNGPYANRWSKTMFGYGPENKHFVLELTYNYGVKSYEVGNDFLGITLKSREVIERAKKENLSIKEMEGKFVIEAPDGYRFIIIDEPQPKEKDPIEKVTLASSNLKNTIQYWNGVLGLKILKQTEKSVTFAFDENQCALEFKDIGGKVNHAKAYGRIAFAVPGASLNQIQNKIQSENYKILTPLIALDTPGKATVTVVILADPDGHEICFVDEEGFTQLSEVEPNADADLCKSINHEKRKQ